MNLMPRNDDAHDAYQQRERFWALVAPIAESWGLVLLVPLFIGIATFAYLHSRTIYVSESVLRLSEQEVAILKSNRVFGATVDSAINAGMTSSVSAVSLDVIKLLNTEDLYKVSISLRSSTEAHIILREIIASLITATSPNKERTEFLGSQLAILQQKRAQLSESLKRVNRAYDNVPSLGASGSSAGAAQLGYLGEPFTLLVGEIAKAETEISNVEMQLKGTFTGVDVLLAPTEASRFVNMVSPFVTLAVVLGFALVSIFVLMHDAWRRAGDSPNLARIRAIVSWRWLSKTPVKRGESGRRFS